MSGILILYKGGLIFYQAVEDFPNTKLLNNSKTLAKISLPIIYNIDYIFLLEKERIE